MSASAAIASPARPIRIPVPPTVPPRRSVPAASGAPPSPPSTPPIAPPTASFQSPSAKPTPIPTAAPIRIVSSAPGRVRASQPAATSATPAPMPAATPIRYHSHIRSSVVPQSCSKTERGVEANYRRGILSSLRSPALSAARRAPRLQSRTATPAKPARPLVGVVSDAFEAADHGEAELGRSRAVDDAVVEGDRDRPGGPGDDLAVPDDRPLGDSADAQDRDLGVVDDRRRQQAAELARARDGERRASELLGLELAGARGFHKPRELVRQLINRARVAVADDRHHQALVGLHGDAEVVTVEVDDFGAFEARIQLGHFLERLGHGLERQRDEPLQLYGAEVAFLDPRDGRHLGVGARHVLGDQLPHPAQRLAASLRGLSRCQTPARGG